MTANDVSIFNRMVFSSECGLGVSNIGEIGNWPPYDIVRTGPDGFQIILAPAGFKIEELSITFQPNLLTVAGAKAGEDKGQFLYRSIAERSFMRRFELPNYAEVRNASLDNGLLKIDLVREIPDAARPRKIEIASAAAENPAFHYEAPEAVADGKAAA